MATERGAIVIFGATGDLARRMLFPSLYFLDVENLLPSQFRIVGAARSDLSLEAFTAEVEKAVRARVGGDFNAAAWGRFQARLRYCAGPADDPRTYNCLSSLLNGTDERVYYLSTSPALYGDIVRGLAGADLNDAMSRIVVEKPIGKSLTTCNAINAELADHFDEKRIFRIDHYLGKETVQNLIALRFANTMFEPLWDKVSIEQVQITVAETVGVEGRWSYYDEYGAMRDMVQNHLLQLLCLVAMEPPATLDPESVRNEKVKVLRSLKPITAANISATVRGQYTRGASEGQPVPGYAEEAGGAKSNTETFVALRAEIDNWRWAGVPFYLRTGKRLQERRSKIVIQFKKVPHSIFGASQRLEANRLTIDLQPNEGISLRLMNKAPTLGSGFELRPLSLDLTFAADQPRRRIAYERLLLEALNNNSTLFVRRDESEAAWSWVDGILDAWKNERIQPAPYQAGTSGPGSTFQLFPPGQHPWFDDDGAD